MLGHSLSAAMFAALVAGATPALAQSDVDACDPKELVASLPADTEALSIDSGDELVPEDVARFKSVRHLTVKNSCLFLAWLDTVVSNNDLIGIEYDSCRFPTTEHFKLVGCRASLTRLRIAATCGLEDAHLQQLSGLKRLTDVDVADCPNVTDAGFGGWQSLGAIRHLRLTGSRKVAGRVFGESKLLSVSVGTGDFDIATFLRAGNAQSLRHVLLIFREINADVGKAFGEASALEGLYLISCTLGAGALLHVPRLRSLDTLNVSGCGTLGDDNRMAICKCESLRELKVSDTTFTFDGVAPDVVGFSKTLRHLNVDGCSDFSAKDFERVWGMAGLEGLVANNCAAFGDEQLSAAGLMPRLRLLVIGGASPSANAKKLFREARPGVVVFDFSGQQ